MHDEPNSVMEQASQRDRSQGYGTCSHCYAPIQDRHSGLRHFGMHTAHQEHECLRILHARIAELERERDALRSFAQDIMEAWPESGVDGGELQESAAEFGLLAEERRTASCGDGCQCATMVGEKEFALGINCYRRTKLLTGKGDE